MLSLLFLTSRFVTLCIRLVPVLVSIEGSYPVLCRVGSGSRRSPTGSEALRWRRGVEACASGEYITVTSLLYKISHPAHSQPGLRIRLGFTRIRIRHLKKNPDSDPTLGKRTGSGSYITFAYQRSPFTFFFQYKIIYN